MRPRPYFLRVGHSESAAAQFFLSDIYRPMYRYCEKLYIAEQKNWVLLFIRVGLFSEKVIMLRSSKPFLGELQERIYSIYKRLCKCRPTAVFRVKHRVSQRQVKLLHGDSLRLVSPNIVEVRRGNHCLHHTIVMTKQLSRM